MASNSLRDPPEADVENRADHWFATGDIVLGGVALGLFINAAVSLATEFGARPLHLLAGHLLGTALLSLIPLRSLATREPSRKQLAALVALTVAVAVASRVWT